jgi:hypothetical protein
MGDRPIEHVRHARQPSWTAAGRASGGGGREAAAMTQRDPLPTSRRTAAQAAALRPASLQRLLTHLVAEHGAAEELRVTPRTLIRRLSFLTQDEKDHLASLSPGVLDKLAEATKKYRSAAQKGQIPGLTGPKGPGDYIPGMPQGGGMDLPDYMFPGGGGGPWQGGSPVGPGGWAGSGMGAGGGGGGGPLDGLGFLDDLGRGGWTPGGGFKPGVGQKGIAPGAFGQHPGAAGLTPEAFGIGRREDPHFRAATWDVRNPGGGVMEDAGDAGSGSDSGSTGTPDAPGPQPGANPPAPEGEPLTHEYKYRDTTRPRTELGVRPDSLLRDVVTGGSVGALYGGVVTLLLAPSLLPIGLLGGAYQGAVVGAAVHEFIHKHRPADDGTGPVGPRSSSFRPADDGTGPVGPRLMHIRPADDDVGPAGPWARHLSASLLFPSRGVFLPDPDSGDPGSPVSAARNARLDDLGALLAALTTRPR